MLSSLIFEKIREIAGETTKDEKFKTSNGWFNRLKSRCNWRGIAESGEVASADEDVASGHPEKLRALIDEGGYISQKEMKKYLYLLLGKVEGLFCILITDRDGVPILEVSTNKAPDYAMRPNFISTFGKAADQGSKLGLGKNKFVISIYTLYQVVQINKLPMVVTFIASKSSNTGHILSLEEHIDPLLNDLKCAIIEP